MTINNYRSISRDKPQEQSAIKIYCAYKAIITCIALFLVMLQKNTEKGKDNSVKCVTQLNWSPTPDQVKKKRDLALQSYQTGGESIANSHSFAKNQMKMALAR